MVEIDRYFCERCKMYFKEKEVFYERETGAWVITCPSCGYQDITRAETCNTCNSLYIEGHYGCCHQCLNSILRRFQDLLIKNFSDKEKELLNHLYDGECF